MILTQTPLRFSFAGGGSDIAAYYERFGGAVVSTAVDRYVYVSVNTKFDNSIRVSYSRTEEVERVEQVVHPLVRSALQLLKIPGGIEITSVADIPSRGTGLGSSSAFTVGLLLALRAYQSTYVGPAELARDACHVEIDLCGEPIGKQDQYAAAYGGFNFIRFNQDGSVQIEPILLSGHKLRQLQSSLITFYTGSTRQASTILVDQTRQLSTCDDTQALQHRMVRLAYDLRNELNCGNVESLGSILHEGWCLKREVHSGISSPQIDAWYEAARKAGAIGGKLLGAGGGGFLTFFAAPDKHEAIEAAVRLRRVDFAFEPSGARVLLFHKPLTRRSRGEADPYSGQLL